jgi:hypothetical protein
MTAELFRGSLGPRGVGVFFLEETAGFAGAVAGGATAGATGVAGAGGGGNCAVAGAIAATMVRTSAAVNPRNALVMVCSSMH